jgi:hypothetical protein
MDIARFASRHRLKVTKDKSDDTTVIVGKAGQIYEYSDTLLGVLFITPAKKAPRTRVWNSLSAQCIAAGMTPRQQGDAEGALTFDPANPEQVMLAIKVAGAKRKRQLTPEQQAAKAAIARRMTEMRLSGNLKDRVTAA